MGKIGGEELVVRRFRRRVENKGINKVNNKAFKVAMSAKRVESILVCYITRMTKILYEFMEKV